MIHTKAKTRLHVKGAPETKIKGRNIRLAGNSLKAGGAMPETGKAWDRRIKKDGLHVAGRKNTGEIRADAYAMEFQDGNIQNGNAQTAARTGTIRGRTAKGDARSRNMWGSHAEKTTPNRDARIKIAQGKTMANAARSLPAAGRKPWGTDA